MMWMKVYAPTSMPHPHVFVVFADLRIDQVRIKTRIKSLFVHLAHGYDQDRDQDKDQDLVTDAGGQTQVAHAIVNCTQAGAECFISRIHVGHQMGHLQREEKIRRTVGM